MGVVRVNDRWHASLIEEPTQRFDLHGPCPRLDRHLNEVTTIPAIEEFACPGKRHVDLGVVTQHHELRRIWVVVAKRNPLHAVRAGRAAYGHASVPQVEVVSDAPGHDSEL